MVLINFCIPSHKGYRKRTVEGLFETQFACDIKKKKKKKKKKKMSDRKTGYSPLNNRVVTNDVMFVYAHEKINIFYDFYLNTQGFVYLKFAKYQLGLQRNVATFHAMYAYLLYSLYGFLPISSIGLAKIEYWSPYYREFTVRMARMFTIRLVRMFTV